MNRESMYNPVAECPIRPNRDIPEIATDPATKIKLKNERRRLIEEGLKGTDPAVRAAAEDLKRLDHDYELSLLMKSVYDLKDPEDPKSDSPDLPGFRNISSDKDALTKLGIAPEDLIEGSFRAQVYLPDPTVHGENTKPVIVFRGTEDWKDKITDIIEPISATPIAPSIMHTMHYDKAITIAQKIGDKNVEFAGHSLGGGLATAASMASGKDATVINPAGVRNDTVDARTNKRFDSIIHNYQVNCEALKLFQEFLPNIDPKSAGGILFLITGSIFLSQAWALAFILFCVMDVAPDSRGTNYSLESNETMNPFSRHSLEEGLPNRAIYNQMSEKKEFLERQLDPLSGQNLMRTDENPSED